MAISDEARRKHGIKIKQRLEVLKYSFSGIARELDVKPQAVWRTANLLSKSQRIIEELATKTGWTEEAIWPNG